MGIVLVALVLVALALVGVLALVKYPTLVRRFGEWQDQRAWNAEMDAWSERHQLDADGKCVACSFGHATLPLPITTSALVAQDNIVLLGAGFDESDFEDDMVGGNDVDPLMVRFGTPLTDDEIEVLREFGY